MQALRNSVSLFFGRTSSNFAYSTPTLTTQVQPYRSLSTLLTSFMGNKCLFEPVPLLHSQIRTHIRIHFPRPRETKRIRVHGWKTRMSTPGGRRVIMRRILKGRFTLTH